MEPKPSSFLQKAQQVQKALLDKQARAMELQKEREEAEKRESLRSAGFEAKGSGGEKGAFSRATQRANDELEEDEDEEDAADYSEKVGRNDDLEVVVKLKPGPRPLPANPDDPKWEKMEPYSGHRLRERSLPHSELKEHLRGRYHIPPSLLYSVARPITPLNWQDGVRNNGDYEVPVDGDFVVIATIVEKSELLVTRGFNSDPAPSRKQHTATNEDNDDDPVLFKEANSDGKLKLNLEPGNDAFQSAKSVGWQKRGSKEEDEDLERRREEKRLSQRPRKFVVLKLVDLGLNSTSSDGDSGGRGDNYLSLIAYEADPIDTSVLVRQNMRSEVASSISATSAATRKWVNGSRGAFELLYKQAEGTVVAVMNPKILRPYASAGKGLESKMLRLTPRSGEDCLIIGQAADYRRCAATKANGQRCGNFVDTKARKQARVSVCDFHLSKHMEELSRGRPEFAANSTSRAFGGSSSSTPASSGFRKTPSNHGEEDSAINKITTSYGYSTQGKAAFKSMINRAALSRKLNSSFGTVGDGMENNAGQVYCSQPAEEGVRRSDPGSWKYDIAGRYGRGSTEKQTRLKRQIEEERLMRKIEARFAPPSATRPKSKDTEGGEEGEEGNAVGEKREEVALPVLPNGTAEMIHAAYSTLDKRKQAAQQKKSAIDAKRRKYTGVLPSPTHTEEGGGKLKFVLPPSTPKSSLTTALPIPGLTRHTPDSKSSSSDSRSKLLSLASSSTTAAGKAEPSLKLKRSHRPKLKLPQGEVGQASKLKVVAGELVNLDHFDYAWEDDLRDAQEEVPLAERILQLNAESQARRAQVDVESDSDLEII